MKKLLFLTIFLAIPAQTFASGCDCGTINGMLTMNRGQTVQMVNAHTTAEGEAIRSEILLAAQNIIGTMKAESATIVRAIVALKESNAANMKGQAIAGQTMKTEDVRQSRAACRTLRHKLAWGRCANRGKSQQGSSGRNAPEAT